MNDFWRRQMYKFWLLIEFYLLKKCEQFLIPMSRLSNVNSHEVDCKKIEIPKFNVRYDKRNTIKKNGNNLLRLQWIRFCSQS